ncbi:MAG: lysine--tRNA ligase [Deltaproteobacteria bacterium]|nr:MAG: lysine--tRNA ligase [Deltaproteobacteria bacterium]
MYPFDPKFQHKLEELRQAGVEPYPTAHDLRVTHLSTALHRAFVGVDDPTEHPRYGSEGFDDVAVGGRLMFRNRMGKLLFLRIQDRGDPTVSDLDAEGSPVKRGGVIQVMVRKNDVGDEAFEALKKLDIGDFVWARGAVVRTRTGELTVKATQARLASKIMAPFPDRFHQLTDAETRYRQRYVDLFINPEVRETFRARSRIVRAVRRFFEDRDFIEVETPMMQTLPGGAAARPFVTHHNALGIELFLRIAPELFLKRLVVGGFERVFEVNRNFRNEGISLKHNPEFTMLEFYMAWATFRDLMDLTEELLVELATQVVGEDLTVQLGAHRIDFTPPYRRASMGDLLVEYAEVSPDMLRDAEALERHWRAHHAVDEGERLPSTWAGWWEWYFDAYVEAQLVNPTFVTDFPAEISPLARRSDADPELTDRFELIIGTWEIANAFTELNDPVDQARRFEAQVAAKEAGDAEAMFFDRDYVRALTYAMPPTAGQGIGIDRLVMLLTGNTSIREVILFPTLRPERWADEPPSDETS